MIPRRPVPGHAIFQALTRKGGYLRQEETASVRPLGADEAV